MLQILLILSFGPRPFRMEAGELTLRFEPRLVYWLFTDAADTAEIIDLQGYARTVELPARSFSAMFLGDVLVTYVNPSGASTYGPEAPGAGAMELVDRAGNRRTVTDGALRGRDARAVRDRDMQQVIVTLG